MKEYDVVVIGSGVGTNIVFKALSAGRKVALVDKGNAGGTCLNVGCIPSKMLIYPADRIAEIREAGRLGIHAEISAIDFGSIMGRMRNTITTYRGQLREMLLGEENLDFYEGECYFSGEYTLSVMGEEIRGRQIFIVAGSRPFVPPVSGLDKVDYLNNETLLDLKSRPERLLILGGGYIAVEYGHFFEAMGAKVTMVQRGDRLVPAEEPEISGLLGKMLGKRMEIFTSSEAIEVSRAGNGYDVSLRDNNTGGIKHLAVEKVLVATGRRSNADLLRVENTGILTDNEGFIIVDDYLRTNRENIWAVGDITGRQMFTHAGDREAEIAWHNAAGQETRGMDFVMVPHAVFTWPQIASIGLTEEQARKDYEVFVGKAMYSDVVKGEAMGEEDGFAKAVVEKETGRILGFHIIGPEASILIQEVVNVVENKGTVKDITESMHIFPALSELIPETLNKLE